MAKHHWVSTWGFQRVSTAIYDGSIGKVCQRVTVNMPISSEMLIGLNDTWHFLGTLLFMGCAFFEEFLMALVKLRSVLVDLVAI